MDYKEMYLKMVRASEQAIRILVEAQRECEELYMSQPDPQLIVLKKDEKKADRQRLSALDIKLTWSCG